MILVPFIILLIGIIAYMQFRYQKMNKNHTTIMNDLENSKIELLQNHKNLIQKNFIAEKFYQEFTVSKEIISREILTLQYELLSQISDKNSEFN